MKNIRYDKNSIGYKINSQRIYQLLYNLPSCLCIALTPIHLTQNLYFHSTDSQQCYFFLKSKFLE